MSEKAPALPKLPKKWEIQAKLPAASICGFSIIPRVRKGLLALDRRVSLLDLYLYLTKQSENAALERLAATQHEFSQLRSAYLRFYELLLNRREVRPSSNKLAWIVPDPLLGAKGQISPSHASKIEEYFMRTVGEERWASLREEYSQWLPYMSLGMINLLRRWRAPRVNSIRRAMFRFAGAFHRDSDVFYPWDPGFDPLAASAPIHALYQFEPTRLVGGAIKSFQEFEFTLIGDLKCLHPAAVSAAKNNDLRQALFSLYRELERTQRK